MNLPMFASQLDAQIRTIISLALIAHQSPDGDAYGSLVGFRGLMGSNYPHLTVSIVIPPEKNTDEHVSWIADNTASALPDCDLVIVLDTSIWSRTALGESPQPVSILSIDHHEPRPESIGGFCDTDAPSCTVILTEIARQLNWTITPETATALLLGIYTDTGGFVHRNSNQRAFEAAGFLLGRGADQGLITSTAFGNYSLDYLHDLGRGLLSIVQIDEIACLFFTETPNNAHLKSHIIGYLSGLAGVDIACVLMQKGDEVKGSFRTRKDNIDVNELAKKFGGGGHKKAAGFTLNGHFEKDILVMDDKRFSAEQFAKYILSL